MKFLLVLLATIGLSSCNTLIGMGRDTKQGFNWTKNKIQESRQGSSGGQSSQQDAYGAPVY
jgi:predicted small secreted protein